MDLHEFVKCLSQDEIEELKEILSVKEEEPTEKVMTIKEFVEEAYLNSVHDGNKERSKQLARLMKWAINVDEDFDIMPYTLASPKNWGFYYRLGNMRQISEPICNTLKECYTEMFND